MANTSKTILITGGSRGIGRQTALLAASQGWSVAFTYLSDATAAEKTAQDINSFGVQSFYELADVAKEADIVNFFANCSDEFGRIDAVVINAGIVAPAMPLAEMEYSRLKHILDVNLLGPLLCAREAARHLAKGRKEPSASIVFVSSAAARLGAPNEYVDYAASKGAVDTLTIGLSKELASANIRVNAVRPGIVETEIHASGGQPDRAAKMADQIPIQRPGTAKEVAAAILWLCSDEASYVTGALLDIAGGR